MIAVDTNVLAQLLLPGVHADRALALREADPAWVAPRLWEAEFRSVLLQFVRAGRLSLPDAIKAHAAAQLLMLGAGVDVDGERVLALAAASGCSSYDCEFVAAAEQLAIPLVTLDAQVLAAFPRRAVSLASA